MLENTRHNIDRLYAAWQTAAGRAGTLWCGLMHDSPLWPIHGQYQCGACGRRYSVPWDDDSLPPAQVPVARPHGLRTVQSSLRSAILPQVIVLIALLASHVQAAEPLIVGSITQVPTTPAAMAFARYTAGLEQAAPWNLETVEIEAALPKVEKRARLRAIRRLLPLGQPDYQVLETAGDHTVTRQVIARYLSAEVRAAAIPASTVAITPANYKFHYKCAVNTDAKVIYVFLIAPRKKREGLIKGELWIDGETGAVVRQSGYLVKQPSIFVKRVDIVQQTSLRAGSAEERVTHLSVDTRLVGLAELTIHERPYTDPVLPPAPVIEQR
jgi:hypothetical protein